MFAAAASPSPSPTLSPGRTRTCRGYHAQLIPSSPRIPPLRQEQRSVHHQQQPAAAAAAAASSTSSPRQQRGDEALLRAATAAGGHSPSARSRQGAASISTADAATQYTPPGYPPTSRAAASTERLIDDDDDSSNRETAAGGTDDSGAHPRPPRQHEEEETQPTPQSDGSATGGRPGEGPVAEVAGASHARRPEAAAAAAAERGPAEHNGRPTTPEKLLAKRPVGEARARVRDVMGASSQQQQQPTGRESGRRKAEDDVGADGHDVGDDDRRLMSPKRSRQERAPVKYLPRKYEDCHVKDLGVLVADMLLELVRHNDALPLKDRELTRFHSRVPPGISISDYLNRIITHVTLTPPLLLSMVYYIDRLCALYPVFVISSLTAHRFLIAAATVAAKGLSDSFWTNKMYAHVGGVTTRELAVLELDFLEKMGWRIMPPPEVLRDYYRSLVERCEGYELEPLRAEEREGEGEERLPSPADGYGLAGGGGGGATVDIAGSATHDAEMAGT